MYILNNGDQVKQVDSVKYLGHFLTCELSDDIDIRRQCRVLNVRGNILSRKVHMCSVPVKLLSSLIRTVRHYIHHICGGIIRKCLSLNCTLHIIILKRNIGLSKYESTSATCAYTNTQCCQSTIRNRIFKFVCRLNKSDNALIKAVLASSVMYSSRIRSHWRRLLYVHGASQPLTQSVVVYLLLQTMYLLCIGQLTCTCLYVQRVCNKVLLLLL